MTVKVGRSLDNGLYECVEHGCSGRCRALPTWSITFSSDHHVQMRQGQKGKDVEKAGNVDIDRMVQETARLKEPERMLKARIEAAEAR